MDPLLSELEPAFMRHMATVAGEYFTALLDTGSFSRAEAYTLIANWQHDFLGALRDDPQRARGSQAAP